MRGSTPGYILHTFDGFELLDELLQAAGVVEHDGERAVEEAVVAVDADAAEQDFLFLADDVCDVVDDSDVVIADDAKGDGVLAAALACPFCLDDAVADIKPQYDGLLIDPCIKHDWDGYTVERRWRKMNLHIEVKNPEHVSKGIAYLEVDGKRLDAAVIPVGMLKDGSKIVAVMGKAAVEVKAERV